VCLNDGARRILLCRRATSVRRRAGVEARESLPSILFFLVNVALEGVLADQDVHPHSDTRKDEKKGSRSVIFHFEFEDASEHERSASIHCDACPRQ
jgi:hypothetical protein